MTDAMPSQADLQLQSELAREPCTCENSTQATLRRLYGQAAGELTGYLRKRFGDGPPDPEDVTQEAFAKLAEHQDLSGVKNLRAFLWRSARNLVLDHKRHEGVRSKYDFEIETLFFALDGIDCGPENVLEARQQLERINDVIAAMPTNRRKAFLLHRLEGLNFSQTARRLGMTPSAVIKHVSRAVLDIKDALKEPASRGGR